MVSEFHMRHDEFWFERTLPQIFLLASARVDRHERSEKESKNKPDESIARIATKSEMDEIAAAFNSQ